MPKGFVKFASWIILAGIVSTVIFVLVFKAIDRAVDYPAVISNLVYSVLNVLTGVVVVLSGVDKKNNVFFTRLMGSLLVRIVVMSGYVALGLAVFKFEEVNFVMSLFIYYFLFLIIEMLYIFPNKEKFNKNFTEGNNNSATDGETTN